MLRIFLQIMNQEKKAVHKRLNCTLVGIWGMPFGDMILSFFCQHIASTIRESSNPSFNINASQEPLVWNFFYKAISVVHYKVQPHSKF